MRTAKTIMVFVVVAIAAGPAVADWNDTQPHKMHFPQLPDPFGWDVNATYPKVLADDWECSQSGPVTDVHFWGSWEYGQEPGIDPSQWFANIHVSIHKNVPVDPNIPESFSHPLDPPVKTWDFAPGEYTVLPGGTGIQGWYDPNDGTWRANDHNSFHQINIVDIKDPFIQELGEIYWLDISVTPIDPGFRWGWKTADVNLYPAPYTGTHFMDDAVWSDLNASGGNSGWNELFDPIEQTVSLDLAFVITPEPGTMALLVLGGLALIRRRK